MKHAKKIPMILAMCFVTGISYNLTVVGNLGKTVGSVSPGECRSLLGMPGSEDLAWDKESSVVYAASQDRRDFKSPGGIFRIDLHNQFSALSGKRMEGNYPENFHPHGIYLLINPAKERILYVVNHAEWHRGHSIEIFKIIGNKLKHIASMKDPMIRNPNSIFAFSETDIYLINDHGFLGGAGKMVEDLLALKRSNVVHFDGKSWAKMTDRIGYAAGLTGNTEGSKKFLYVGAATEHAVKEYEIKPDHSLSRTQDIKLDGAPDNLHWGPDGGLWIAIHPVPVRFLPHFMMAGWSSPSQAAVYRPERNFTEIVYSDPGETISAVTVALRTDQFLFMGPVMDKPVLVCKIR